MVNLTFRAPHGQTRRRPRIRFHRPRKSRLFFAALAVLATGLAMAVDSFAQPATRPQVASAYTNTGAFSYTAQTIRPDPVVYPSGVAQTGQPLVIGDVDAATVSFAYQFTSRLRHEINGTIALQVVFLGDSGWRNAYHLVSPAPFSGDVASTSGQLSLSTLGQLLAKLQAGSKSAARAYTVYLQPVVEYEGVVGGHKVHGTFTPTLPFTLDAAVFAPQALNLRDPSSQVSELGKELHPAQTGDLTQSVANVISFFGLHAPAMLFRIVGCLLTIVALVVALRSQRRRRDDVWSHEKRVAFRAGRTLVDVRGLCEAVPPGSIVTEVPAFDDLVALAVQTSRPILREPLAEVELFGVDVPPRLYLYRKALEQQAQAQRPKLAAAPEPQAADGYPEVLRRLRVTAGRR